MTSETEARPLPTYDSVVHSYLDDDLVIQLLLNSLAQITYLAIAEAAAGLTAAVGFGGGGGGWCHLPLGPCWAGGHQQRQPEDNKLQHVMKSQVNIFLDHSLLLLLANLIYANRQFFHCGSYGEKFTKQSALRTGRWVECFKNVIEHTHFKKKNVVKRF